MKIVTGFVGENHITSNDDQGRNQGIFGTGSYVLPVRSQFAASIVSANEIAIGDGEGVMQGVHFRIEPNTSTIASLENGSQGMQRIDLITARYERTQAGIESVTLTTITGTPAASSPTVPTYITGDILGGDMTADMPLYKITIDGVSIANITPLFDVLPAIDDLPDIYESQGTAVKHTTGTAVGSASRPVYVAADGTATAGNTFVPNTGGTFTGNLNVNRANGTASDAGSSILTLGNSTKADAAGNSYGALRLYSMTSGSAQTFYVTLLASGQTAHRNLYFKHNAIADNVVKPNGTTAVGSGTQPVYVTAAGTVTASTSDVGTSSRPMYLKDGVMTAMSDWLNQSVKSTASPTFNGLTTGGYINASSGTGVGIRAASNSYANMSCGSSFDSKNYANSAYQQMRATAFNVQSSRRVKKNIKNMSEEEARKILDVDVVDFDYVKAVGGAKGQHGVIAEDVIGTIPSVVTVPENYDEKSDDVWNTMGVDYSKFVPYLIKMVQMQAAEIAELKAMMGANS